MEKVTKKQAEDAVAAFLAARRDKKEAEARMKEAEAEVGEYCYYNIDDFTDDRLSLGGAIVEIIRDDRFAII